MSLEAEIKSLREAVEANTAAMNVIIASAKARSAGATTEKPAKATEPEDDLKLTKAAKPADEDDEKGKPGRGRPPGAKNKPKAPTEADLIAVAKKVFADTTIKQKEKDRRQEFGLALMEEYGGVKKVTQIAEEHWADAIRDMNDFLDGKTPRFLAAQNGDPVDDDEDDDDDALI